MPEKPALKDPKNWKIAGKPIKRFGTRQRVTGQQIYGFDLTMPGMLIATIKECPVFGGKVKSFDAAKVTSMKGVKKVLQVGDTAVAVVADTFWQAKTALDALPIVWDEGPNAKVSSASIAEWLKAGLDADQAFVGNQNGDAKAAIASAAKKVEAVYSYPYQNHVCMEPMNATARYTPDKCEVWVPTQDGEGSFAACSPPPVCRPTSATSTRSTSAAASAGAAGSRTTCIRLSASPRRCRARRSSCSGPARKTWCRAGITRSCSASWSARSTRTTT